MVISTSVMSGYGRINTMTMQLFELARNANSRMNSLFFFILASWGLGLALGVTGTALVTGHWRI